MSQKFGLIPVLMVAALMMGCAAEEPATTPERERAEAFLPEPSPALSEALLAALAQAKNLHHIADVHLADGDSDRAIAALRRILEIRFPDAAPEAEDVRLDARARIAKVLLMNSELDAALEAVQTGIDGASRSSFFVANLYTVKGEIHQARARSLDDTDPSRAAIARAEAIRAYERSNEISSALQETLMKQTTTAEPRP